MELLRTPPFLAEASVARLLGARPPYGVCQEDGRGICEADAALQLITNAAVPSGPRTFQRCAVVGSGAALLNQSHGGAIDAHDAVVRLNDAPVTRWAPRAALRKQFPHSRLPLHVGTRTTWRLSTPMAWQMATEADDEGRARTRAPQDALRRRRAAAARTRDERNRRLLAACEHILYCHNPSSHGAAHCHQRVARPGAVVLNPSFVEATRRVAQRLAGHLPSSAYGVPSAGLVGVALALASCAVVSLYGFATRDDDATRSSGCAKYNAKEWWDEPLLATRAAEVPTGARCAGGSTYFHEGHWHAWALERAALRALERLGRLEVHE